jgi:hypothetical protein
MAGQPVDDSVEAFRRHFDLLGEGVGSAGGLAEVAGLLELAASSRPKGRCVGAIGRPTPIGNVSVVSGVLVASSDGLPPVREGYSKGLIAVRRLMTITSETESHAPLLVREPAGLRSGGPVAAPVALRSADRGAIRREAGAGYQATTQTLGWI